MSIPHTITLSYAWIVGPGGKISTGGRRPHFTKKGKIYSLTNLRKHFAMMTGPVNRPGFRADALLEAYEGCQLHVETYQFQTSSGISYQELTYEVCKHHPDIELVLKEVQRFPHISELASALLLSSTEQSNTSSIVLKYCLEGVTFNFAERDFSLRLKVYANDLRELTSHLMNNAMDIEEELTRLEELTPADKDWANREKDWKALKKFVGKLPQ